MLCRLSPHLFALLGLTLLQTTSVGAARTVDFLAMSRMSGTYCFCHIVVRNFGTETQSIKIVGGIRKANDTIDQHTFIPHSTADASGFVSVGPGSSTWFGLTGSNCDRIPAMDIQECYGTLTVRENTGSLRATGYMLLNDLANAAYAIGRNVEIHFNSGRPF